MKNSAFKRHFLFLAAVLCLAGSFGYAAFAKCTKMEPGTQDMSVVFVHPSDEVCKIYSKSAEETLSPEQMKAPSNQDVEAVEDWLRSEGFVFQPVKLPFDPHYCWHTISFTATDAQIAHAFAKDEKGAIVIPPRFKGIVDFIGTLPCKKPAIYLYPPHDMRVNVRLEYDGEVSVTYPEYHNGWDVTAHPDGRLVNNEDGREYAYLFWEGTFRKNNLAFADGFVVKAEDSANFLRACDDLTIYQ